VKDFAIVTAIGSDRVGIVDDLTTAILDKNCNIEESRMTVLGGEFAVMLLLSGEHADIEALIGESPRLAKDLDLHISMKQTVAPKTDSQMRPYLIESVSLDTPGIVHAITATLRHHGINIEDLETDTAAAPWTGAPLFVMRGRISIPPGVSLAELREEIEMLEIEQNLDIKLTPVTVAPLEF
jgi:glycine cleavage system transcriptional repressor